MDIDDEEEEEDKRVETVDSSACSCEGEVDPGNCNAKDGWISDFCVCGRPFGIIVTDREG